MDECKQLLESSEESSSSLQVLLVDDQAIVGEAVRRLLMDEKDIDLHYCADPANVLSQVATIQPTVILLDLVMPKIGGLEVLRDLRQSQETANVPVVLLSTTDEAQVKSEAFAAGANDYLVKLPDKVELVARIRYHSRSYRNLQERDEADRALRESQQQLLDSNTALTTLNEAFLVAKEDADNANAAKSEFLSRMSHELRTPLNVVLGFGQVLEMEPLNDRQKRSVENILKGGRHLLDLINEVLDIARIEAGRLSLSLEPVRLDALISEAIDFMKPLADNRSIRLQKVLPAETNETEGIWVKTDLQRCKQVLLNLLSNAIKYNHDGGDVTVTCETRLPNRLLLNVLDTGPGIPPEKMQKLFQPFERLGAEQSEVEGTGIGLALSKRLVEAMGGSIYATSKPGEGSKFTVEIPLCDPTQEGANGVNISTNGLAPGMQELELSILYIEDNHSNLQLVETLLSYWPKIRLLTAMQGSLGLDMARQHHPDLILLDLHLPDINGDEVLRRLKLDDTLKNIPAVMLSADATPRQITRLLAAGAYDYLSKPLDVKLFRETLEKVAAQKRQA